VASGLHPVTGINEYVQGGSKKVSHYISRSKNCQWR